MSADAANRQRWVQPEWWGPLPGWIGGVVPFNLLLGKSEAGAVLAENLTVYPNGIAFDLHALLRPGGEPQQEEEVLPTDRVRYGIEFEDGRRAERAAPVGGPGDFTIMAFQEGRQVAPDPSANVVLNAGSSGSGPEYLWESRFIWPLPSDPLTFFCEWEDAGIAEQRVSIHADALQDALERAHPGWSG